MLYLYRTGNGRNNIAFRSTPNPPYSILQRTGTGRNNIKWLSKLQANGSYNILQRNGNGRNNILWSNIPGIGSNRTDISGASIDANGWNNSSNIFRAMVQIGDTAYLWDGDFGLNQGITWGAPINAGRLKVEEPSFVIPRENMTARFVFAGKNSVNANPILNAQKFTISKVADSYYWISFKLKNLTISTTSNTNVRKEQAIDADVEDYNMSASYDNGFYLEDYYACFNTTW